MALIYHVTPITPNHVLESLAGRAMMLRWGRHDQTRIVESISPLIAYDCGAFGFFKKGIEMKVEDWLRYYHWLEPRIYHPGRWAIIPDVINEGSQIQDMLINQWPFGKLGVPVWHTDEPLERLRRLLIEWPRVAIGATGEHWQIWKPGRVGKELSPPFHMRAIEIGQMIASIHNPGLVHFLRGTTLGPLFDWITTADSSSLGQNAHLHRKKPMGLFDNCGAVDYADKLERNARFR